MRWTIACALLTLTAFAADKPLTFRFGKDDAVTRFDELTVMGK